MNKMMLSVSDPLSSYSSSGFTTFGMQSTSNTSEGCISLVNLSPKERISSAEFQLHGKYNVYEIANWFLLKETMTHKKLQKLCYYAQAWFYALKDIRLMDTVFEAWIHGPVSPVLYDKFKSFGYSCIKLAGSYVPHIEEGDIELLESVWETYGDHTGNALEALSHSELPWIEARTGYAPHERCSVAISVESMKKYYRSIYIGGDA